MWVSRVIRWSAVKGPAAVPLRLLPTPRAPVTRTAALPPTPVTVIGSGLKMPPAISALTRPRPRRPQRPPLPATISIAPTAPTWAPVGIPVTPISSEPIPICRLWAIGSADDDHRRRHRNVYGGHPGDQPICPIYPHHGQWLLGHGAPCAAPL